MRDAPRVRVTVSLGLGIDGGARRSIAWTVRARAWTDKFEHPLAHPALLRLF